AECLNARVAECTVLDRTGGGTMQAAIEVAGSSPGTVIRGNRVGKGRRGDIIAPGAGVEGNQGATLGGRVTATTRAAGAGAPGEPGAPANIARGTGRAGAARA